MTMLNSLAGALREAGMNYDKRIDDPNFYRYLVKAVLERMREPTAELLDAMYEAPKEKEISNCLAQWQAAIDYILK